ncbi:MAG: alpha/beta hydrolase [Nocardia sp.]|nr:alpha/beta hydrolase [Nocardia sp.]
MADTVGAAARNAWALTFGEGIEAPVRTPSTVLLRQPHRLLRRYDLDPGGPQPVDDTPVLLIPPLAAPASCFDLSPDQSLVRFLLDIGRRPYLVDYGEIGYADRRMGFQDWIHDILPEAIGRVSADRDGTPVDVIGWSLGGIFALLTAAADAALPIRSITAVGAPMDYSRVSGVPQVRVLARLDRGRAMSAMIRLTGGIPAQMTRIGYRATSWDRELRRPLFVASNLANADRLARMEVIDRFQNEMPGYPGRFYDQLWRRFVLANDIGKGVVKLGSEPIRLSEVTAPVLLIGGPSDVIAPAAAVERGLRTLTGAREVRYETAPGSHLGILIERDTTWCHIDKFLRDQS